MIRNGHNHNALPLCRKNKRLNRVEWYHYEPFFIAYKKVNGQLGRYYPDFLIKYCDNDTLYLREIKADYLHDSLETQAKYEAAIDYVSTLNMCFLILLHEDIKLLDIKLDDIVETKLVEVIHKPHKKVKPR